MSAPGRLGLGVDTGGTFTKILLVSKSGTVLRGAKVDTRPDRPAAEFVRRVAAAVKRLERAAGRRAQNACLAVAGDVDPVRGRLRRSPNLPMFEGFPFKESLSRALSRSVEVHNDANMAAWACYAMELKRRCADVVALTMGTGIGGGIVLGGRLHTGATGSAAELGHMRVEPGGAPCRCGAAGCLEAYAGKYGLERMARELLAGRPGISSRLRGRGRIEPIDIARAARLGDPLAREVWKRAGRALGIGIVNLVYLLNPDVVMLVGGVARSSELFLGEVRKILKKETFRAPFGHVRVAAARSSDYGALGAALYSLESRA